LLAGKLEKASTSVNDRFPGHSGSNADAQSSERPPACVVAAFSYRCAVHCICYKHPRPPVGAVNEMTSQWF
jgi:hypothetical protein